MGTLAVGGKGFEKYSYLPLLYTLLFASIAYTLYSLMYPLSISHLSERQTISSVN